MHSIPIFDSISESLLDRLGDVRSEKTQLPGFQRDWTWSDEQIRGLAASDRTSANSRTGVGILYVK